MEVVVFSPFLQHCKKLVLSRALKIPDYSKNKQTNLITQNTCFFVFFFFVIHHVHHFHKLLEAVPSVSWQSNFNQLEHIAVIKKYRTNSMKQVKSYEQILSRIHVSECRRLEFLCTLNHIFILQKQTKAVTNTLFPKLKMIQRSFHEDKATKMQNLDITCGCILSK